MRLFIVILCVVGLSGCSSYLTLIDGLNERQVQSCIEYQGTMRAGSGLTPGGHLSIHGVTATGGAAVDMCLDRFDLQGDGK